MPTAARAIFWPGAALVALTFLVWLRLFVVRVSEMRRLGIAPQSVATSAKLTQRLVDSRAADNFRNLFELPVLFYAALGVAFALDGATPAVHVLAWLFVALRYVHSAIQCGYNRVVHRFVAYLAGASALWALWGMLAWELLQ